MNTLNLSFKDILKNTAIDMYGHEVGAQVIGTYGHKSEIIPVIVLDKKDCGDGIFSYLVQGQYDPKYIAHAVTRKDGNVLIDNARIIGSPNLSYHVASIQQARIQLGF